MQVQDPSRPVMGYPAPYASCPPKPGSTVPVPPQHPTVYSNNSSSSGTILLCLLAAVVIGSFIIIFFLPPTIPDFQVDSLSLSNFSVSNSSYVTGNWNVRFSVSNAKKNIALAYDDVSSSIFYKHELISMTRLPPFNQQTRNRTVLDATFSVTDNYVDASVVNDINGDRIRGIVSFNVKVFGTIEFSAGVLSQRLRSLWVFCEGLPVGVSSNRTGSWNLVGGPRDCTVGV